MASLVDYAVSDKQRDVVLAVEKFGTIRGAARSLKIDPNTLKDHLRKVKAKAALQGWSIT